MESLKIGSGWEKKCIVGSAISLNKLHMFSIRGDHQRIVPFHRKVHTSHDGITAQRGKYKQKRQFIVAYFTTFHQGPMCFGLIGKDSLAGAMLIFGLQDVDQMEACSKIDLVGFMRLSTQNTHYP